MNYRHLILFGSALLLTSIPAISRQLSEDEAKSVALSFIGKKSPRYMPGKSQELKVAFKAERKSEKAYYVFNHGDDAGFLIVSADDRLPQVLGYSSNGKFDYASAPENLKWWLGQYEEEIYRFYSQDNVISTLSDASQSETDSKAAIDPLLSTQWNQDAPFNNNCPTDAGGRSVTGCVATALAQIVNYHKYPAQNGTGTYSYTWNGQTLSYDYSTANFDWGNMLDSYSSSSSEASQEAVANLMLACGIGVNMNYSSNESSSSVIAVPRVLVENLGYDGSIDIVQRSSYSLEEWQDIIYNELSQNRPVYYSGQANTGGHAFVCDGYSGNGYFHINWGWGGHSDGDFLLSALNPSDQGIGSFEGGYNKDQSAVINIMENKGNARQAILFTTSAFTYSNGLFNTEFIWNYSSFEVKATSGIEIVSENGTEQATYAEGGDISIIGPDLNKGEYSGVSHSFQATPQGLTPGKYRCYLVYKTADTPWKRLRSPYGEQQYVELTVGEDGSMTYTNPGSEIAYDIAVTSFSVSGKIYHDSKTTCTVTIKNNADADYNNTIRMDVSSSGNVVKSEYINISVAANQSFTGSFGTTFDLEPGNYEVNFFDTTGKSINSQAFTITVEEGNAPVLASGLIVKGLGSDLFYENYQSQLPLILFNNSNSTVTVGSFTIKIRDLQGNVINEFGVNGYEFGANLTLNYGIDGFRIPAQAGKYFLEVLADGKSLGDPVAIYNAGEVDGLWYTLTEDAAHARLVRAPVSTAVENGILDLPSEVTLAGTVYGVTAFESNALANYSNISTIFLRSETAPTGLAAAVAGLADAVFYVENYDNYVGLLGEDIYAILKKIDVSEPVSAALSFNVGSEFQFDVIYTPSEHINHEITISSDPENILEFTQGSFADGHKTINCKKLQTGKSTVTVTSAQPGEAVKNMFVINNIPTGIDQISDVSDLTISTSGNTIIVDGLPEGYPVNVFNSAGQTVASRISDGQTVRIDMPAGGIYIVSAGNISKKVVL